MANTKGSKGPGRTSLRVEELDEYLGGPLESPQAVLDALVSAAAKGQLFPALFDKLHAVATEQDKLADLAFAYESLTQDRRVKLLSAEAQAAVFLAATQFFADVFGDPDGAVAYAERVVAVEPGHPEAVARLERIFGDNRDNARLSKLYFDLATHDRDPAGQLRRLRQVVEVAADVPGLAEITSDALARLNKLDPSDSWVRDALEQRLVAAGKPREAIKLLEASLLREPAPSEIEAFQLRTRLLELYTRDVSEPHRAVPHIEALLTQTPAHAEARRVAEALLDNRAVSARVAAALSDAYFKLGLADQAAAMLNLELKTVRGPRRLEVQRRLAFIKQDGGDPAGALELLGPVVSAEPGEDEARRRFVELSLSLNQPAEAAKLLNRALGTCKEPAVRARVGAEIGTVYLRSGDVKRAEAAFKQVVEDAADPSAMLTAGRHLVELSEKAGDNKALGAALELVARLETEAEPRNAAARRLAKLAEGELNDPAKAISAYRALVDSPWADDALKKLQGLYEEQGDFQGLIDVTERRAARAKDPGEGRHLSFRAAELRTEKGRDRAAALDAWRAYLARFGPAREVHAQMIPLLEQEKQWKELAWVLERELELASAEDQVPLLTRLAQLKLSRLDDVAGGLAAYERALAADPSDKVSRAAVEKLMLAGDSRLAAADVLERVFRREEPGTGLLRVLETRAELASEPEAQLAAIEEALAVAAEHLKDPARALELAARGLGLVVAVRRSAIGLWLGRAESLGTEAGRPAARAAALAGALADHPVDSPEMCDLARAAAEALVASGDPTRAVAVYRRALAFDPSSADLLSRIDELLAEQGSPEERLALYRDALGRGPEGERKKHLLHSMARLLGGELGRPDEAIATWRLALEEDPRDAAAHQALVECYTEMRQWPVLYAELERALKFHEGERRNTTLLRMAEVAAESDSAKALEHYRELLGCADLSDSVLENIELLAHSNGDADTMKQVLERRIAVAGAPEDRAALLEKLGLVQAKQLVDPEAAAKSWLSGARAADAAGDDERARRMYERVLGVSPDEAEAARRLISLYAASGAWEKIPEAFGVLHRSGADERDVVALVLSLEAPAIAEGAIEVFVVLTDGVLAREGIDPARLRQVLLSRARALSTSPAHRDEVAAIYRRVLESGADDVQAAAETFTVFLATSELTPARVADRRWLFEWRASRASDPTTVLIAWALAEETTLGNPAAAIELYKRVLDRDPERVDALSQLARLQSAHGDAEGALTTLTALCKLGEGEQRTTAEIGMVSLWIERLGRPADALSTLAHLLDVAPQDPEVMRLTRALLSFDAVRAPAAVLLEKVADSAETRETRAELLQTLIDVTHGVDSLCESRVRWYERLLECREDDDDAALAVALAGAEELPHVSGLWDSAERIARRLNRPEPVAAVYGRCLDRELGPDVAEELGRRFVEFNEEWFEDAERVIALLTRVLELCPTADWAFDRLKLAFNGAARWDELFALYDRELSRIEDGPRKVEILREAAMAAKDFANDADRAIEYLERLERAAPGDARIEASLERLYEREGRTRPLIALLSRRLDHATGGKKSELLMRVARLWLDVGDPVEAYGLLERVLAEPKPSAEVHELLERLVALPAARESMAPSEESKKKKKHAKSVRHAAAELLRKRYEAEDDVAQVARMLEVELELADTKQERVSRLEKIIQLKLDSIGDYRGAFESVAQLVALEPHEALHRVRLAELGGRTGDQARRAELLVTIAGGCQETDVRLDLLLEAAAVQKTDLSDAAAAAELLERVLAEAGPDQARALSAARELDPLLEATGRAKERVGVLERLAELEDEPERRKAALGAAARVSGRVLKDWDRAIRAWRARLNDDAGDVEALDGLADAVAAQGNWADLVSVLEARAALSGPEAARRDRTFVARLWADQLGDRERAVATWKAIRAELGPDAESFEALAELFRGDQRWVELTDLTTEEIAAEQDTSRKHALSVALGATHLDHTGELEAALAAFVRVGAWDRAASVLDAPTERPRARALAERLLADATEAWKGGDTVAGDSALLTLEALGKRLSDDGEHAAVVELFLAAGELPYPKERRRALLSEAACLCSDRLADADRALTLFRKLFAEDSADKVSQGVVTRFALLLEEQKLDSEIATLWEDQAKARAALGEAGAAAALFARAADIAESRLGNQERAIENHRAAADLGSEPALDALARIFDAAGRPADAAAALERLCERSSRDELGARTLRLAEAYLRAGQPDLARARLEHAAGSALDAAGVRQRLAELYRAQRAWAPLAQLLTTEAERAPDNKTRLRLLQETAKIHVDRLQSAEAAIPLLEQAIELDPDDPALRLGLAAAFTSSGRLDDALGALKKQIERYGTRKPKDRALVHFQLARTSLAAGRRAEAIAELDFANKIDPAHPGILQALAKLAFEEGQLDRAEKQYRALLLVLGRDDDDAPSRAEALLDLAEIASRSGDDVRAAELIDSAFEAALESVREADALEAALRTRGRYDLLARSVEGRLARADSPAEAARALADLAFLHAEHLGGLAAAEGRIRDRARSIHSGLDDGAESDDRAWAALGRVYDFLGDASAEADVLERRVSAALASGRSELEPDAFYRLAEIRLNDPPTLARGIEVLERALELAPDLPRAEAMLRSAIESQPGNEALVALFERVARAKGDDTLLLEALAKVVELDGPHAEALREGVAIAERIERADLCESLLRAGLRGDDLLETDTAWALCELGALCAERGELGEALTLREQAAGLLPPDEARALRLTVARQAAGEANDPAAARRIYEALLEQDPADREVWEPLASVYRRLGASEALVALIGRTVPLVESSGDRAQLRLEQAEILLDEGRSHEATTILQEILEEDPGQERAADRLLTILEQSGLSDPIVSLLTVQIDTAKDRQDVPRLVAQSLRLGKLLESMERASDAYDVYVAVLDWDKSSGEILRAVLRLAELRDDPYVVADVLESLLRVERGEPAVEIAARLVMLRTEQGDEEGAARALELGFVASPTTVELRDPLLDRYAAREDWAGASRVLRDAVRVVPNDRELLGRLIDAHRCAGESAVALEILDSLSEMESDPQVSRARAALLSDVGRDEEAVLVLEAAFGFDPEAAHDLIPALERAIGRGDAEHAREHSLRLAEVLERVGDADGARARLVDLGKQLPKDREVVRRLAELEGRAERWDAASMAYRKLIALEEGEALTEAALSLADACERAGRFGDARGGLERAHKLAPHEGRLKERLRALYEAVGDSRELARFVFEEAAAEQQVQRRFELLLQAGNLLLMPDGDPARAVEILTEARGLSPDSTEGATLLARAWATVGRGEEAMTLLGEVVGSFRGRRARELAPIYREMSRIQLAEGFLSDALGSLTKAFEMDMKNARLAMELGQLALDMDETEVAARAFRGVTMLRAGDEEGGEVVTGDVKAHANYQLALLAQRAGDPRRARMLASKALAENADHHLARQLISELDGG
ncbi:MAG: tetratricopeptide repeat protein [Polyangiaceae bacterium]|nr:tetratricopeptide repeat protein [Polyangiaceae bacterium]